MTNKKRHLVVLLILIITAFSGYSQPGQGRRQQERMEALNSRRIAFITDRMSLSPQEAQLFWPLYNEYSQQRDALMHGQYKTGASNKTVAEMSQAEVADFAESEIQRLEESAAIKREFHENLKDILSIEKIALLYEAERDFNKMIFREARQQKGPPQGRR